MRRVVYHYWGSRQDQPGTMIEVHGVLLLTRAVRSEAD